MTCNQNGRCLGGPTKSAALVIRQTSIAVGLVLSLSSAGLAHAQADDRPGSVSGVTRPATVLLEVDRNGQYLNFDLLLTNHSSDTQTIVFMRLEVFGADGRFVTRRDFSRNGLPGAIQTLPEREIPSGGSLTIFNPFVAWPSYIPLSRLRYSIFFSRADPLVIDIRPEHWLPDVALRLPFRERVFVDSGNSLFSHHRRVALTHPVARELGMDVLTQRFAIDFTVVDASGKYRNGSVEQHGNWYAWGTEVLSPGEGLVVFARGNVPDGQTNPDGSVTKPESYESFGPDASAGNYVVIRHSNEVFSMLAHLRHGTVAVATGDSVSPGQSLGTIGLSGDTGYPHLHFQLQAGPDILLSEPRPAYFECVLRQSDAAVVDSLARLTTGALVAPCR